MAVRDEEEPKYFRKEPVRTLVYKVETFINR